MAWQPDDPVRRRDAALDRTRRLTAGVAGGAAAATAVLGFAFAHAFTSHPGGAGSAASPSPGGQGRPAGAGGSGTAGARPDATRAPRRASVNTPSQPPAPAYSPPQVVSGGS